MHFKKTRTTHTFCYRNLVLLQCCLCNATLKNQRCNFSLYKINLEMEQEKSRRRSLDVVSGTDSWSNPSCSWPFPLHPEIVAAPGVTKPAQGKLGLGFSCQKREVSPRTNTHSSIWRHGGLRGDQLKMLLIGR